MRQLIVGWLAALCLLWAGPASAVEFKHPGGVVTAAQIERARLALAEGKEPWKSAWAQLLSRAQAGLGEAPSAVADLYVPGYYEDPAGCEAAKKVLRDDVNAAYYSALAYQIGYRLDAATRERHAAKARELIGAWALVNRSVSGADGRLVMAYVGTAFVTTAELLANDPGWSATERARFTQWTATVLADVATIESRTNNWGSWGVFAGLAGAHWRNDAKALAQHTSRLKELIDSQIDPAGKLPLELGRGAKGLWYTYFSLAPLTHAAYILRNTTGEDLLAWQPASRGSLEQALDAFLTAAVAAQTSSTSGDASVTPQRNNWGGDLLFATGNLYGKSSWTAWAKPPLGATNSAWKTADLLVLAPTSSAPASPPGSPQLLD